MGDTPPPPGTDAGTDDPTDASVGLVEDDRPRLVRFVVGGVELLVDVTAVVEVLVAGPVTRLPGSVPAIAGVTSVRGRIVAVVEPSAALGASMPTTRDRFLVVATEGGPVALVVDRVESVVAADVDDIESTPTAAEMADDSPPEPGPTLVVATATVDGRRIPVIDPVALVRAAIDAETSPNAPDHAADRATAPETVGRA